MFVRFLFLGCRGEAGEGLQYEGDHGKIEIPLEIFILVSLIVAASSSLACSQIAVCPTSVRYKGSS